MADESETEAEAEAEQDDAAAQPEANQGSPDADAEGGQPEGATEQAAAAPVEPAAEAGAGLSREEVLAWKGHRLDEIGGAAVGKVEDAYFDERTGRPEWLQARMGRFGHHCLVPARDAVGGVGRVWVPYSRDEIRGAPRIEPGKPLERDQERALLQHYGVGAESAGRGADLAELDPDAVTARPAS